jgi:hypothetical protein
MCLVTLQIWTFYFDALQEGSADAVACLPVPRASACSRGFFLLIFPFCLVVSITAFSCKAFLIFKNLP